MAWQDLEQQYVKENNKNDRSNYLKDIIAGLSIANNNDPKTLIGYGLGRWLSNYVNRGLERRQQEKNQKAYDEWINGGPQVTPQEQQLMPLMQGTPFNNNNENKYTFANDIAKQMTGGRPNYMQNAIDAATGHKQGEPFFAMPQAEAGPENQQTEEQQNDKNLRNQQQNVKQTAQDIARQMWGGANLSSEEAFANAYRIARANGSTETQALDFARRRAGEQQSRRIQALSDEFLANGVGLDGVINPYGVQVLSRLAQEDPKQTNVLANMYQTPLGNTKYQQDLAKMLENSNLHLRNTIQAQQHQAELRDWLSANEYGRKWDMLTRKEQLDMENKFRTAEIVSQITGAPIRDVVANMFGGGRGGNSGGGGKADNAQYKMLKDWLENYDKVSRDPVTGEYFEGKGPSDPEYIKRKKAYDAYTDNSRSDDNDTFTAETPEDAIRQIRQKHPDWPPEYVQWLVNSMGFDELKFQDDKKSGTNGVYSVPQSKASEGNAYTAEELEKLRELGILDDEE